MDYFERKLDDKRRLTIPTELRAGNQIINNHKIYGGDFEGNGGVLIGTNNLINNENAVIASRSQMNIGAHSITNHLNGLIQTQGDLNIGRDLGTQAQNYAVTGMADSLTNNSATIEVGGNALWGVAETANKNTQFTVQAAGQVVTKPVSYYIVNGQQLGINTNYHFNVENIEWTKAGVRVFLDGNGKTMTEAYHSNLNKYNYNPDHINPEW